MVTVFVTMIVTMIVIVTVIVPFLRLRCGVSGQTEPGAAHRHALDGRDVRYVPHDDIRVLHRLTVVVDGGNAAG